MNAKHGSRCGGKLFSLLLTYIGYLLILFLVVYMASLEKKVC